MKIDTYAHVFERMASPWLLGMPFIQEFTSGWDVESKQVILKNKQGTIGSVPLHSKEEVPRILLIASMGQSYCILLRNLLLIELELDGLGSIKLTATRAR